MALVDEEYMTTLFTLLADRVDASKLYQYSIVYDTETSTYRDAVCASFYSTKDFDVSSDTGQKALIDYLVGRKAYIMTSGVLWDISSGDSNIFYVVTECYAAVENSNYYLCFRGYNRDAASTPAEKRINYSSLTYYKSNYIIKTTTT